jgi:hypothetical protein
MAAFHAGRKRRRRGSGPQSSRSTVATRAWSGPDIRRALPESRIQHQNATSRRLRRKTCQLSCGARRTVLMRPPIRPLIDPATAPTATTIGVILAYSLIGVRPESAEATLVVTRDQVLPISAMTNDIKKQVDTND